MKSLILLLVLFVVVSCDPVVLKHKNGSNLNCEIGKICISYLGLVQMSREVPDDLIINYHYFDNVFKRDVFREGYNPWIDQQFAMQILQSYLLNSCYYS